MGHTWYIVKTWDCDGLRLNEGWLKGPFTLRNYAANYFRPASFKQVEWTFPITYKKLRFNAPIPETFAMMKLIEAVKPRFLYSLHNYAFGGVYRYVTEGAPNLAEALHNAAARADIPLDIAEPEMPFMVPLDMATFPMVTVKEIYDYLEENGVENPCEEIKNGFSSDAYAAEFGDVRAIVTEVHYFKSGQIDDVTATDSCRRDLILDRIVFDEEAGAFARASLDRMAAYLVENDPYRVSLAYHFREGQNAAKLAQIKTDVQFEQKATVSEAFSSNLSQRFYSLCNYGMLVRMIENMLASCECEPERETVLLGELESVRARFNELADALEKQVTYAVIPIKKLIALQLEAGLIYLNRCIM